MCVSTGTVQEFGQIKFLLQELKDTIGSHQVQMQELTQREQAKLRQREHQADTVRQVAEQELEGTLIMVEYFRVGLYLLISVKPISRHASNASQFVRGGRRLRG
jgi:hypothetical protein